MNQSSDPSDYAPIPIANERAVRRPRLPGSVVVRPDVEGVIDTLASDLLFQSKACVRAFGDFHLALSGGSTPEPLYRGLMIDPMFRDLPWKRTHLWIVDERRVPLDDEKSNFRMIKETLVDHADIPRDQVHAIRATDARADEAYEAELREHLGWREKGHDRLDFVVLGMGADGHTASLFPRSPALAAAGRLVAINEGPAVTPPDRVTMTFDLLNAARMLAVMVTGEKKRDMLARIERGDAGVGEIPILGVKPKAGELRWYLDAAACQPGGA